MLYVLTKANLSLNEFIEMVAGFAKRKDGFVSISLPEFTNH